MSDCDVCDMHNQPEPPLMLAGEDYRFCPDCRQQRLGSLLEWAGDLWAECYACGCLSTTR